MPNLNHLERKFEKPSFTKDSRSSLLSVRREDILHRTDIKIAFFYALAGITISLAIAGGVYVIGKQLTK